jgi:amino acid transporter
MASKPDYNEKNDEELGVIRTSSNDAVPASTSKEGYPETSFWTRMGCTAESFKRRRLSDENNQLNQTLKKRHLHMIAVNQVVAGRQKGKR